MMKEVEAGNVEYLCIKDMSRMGRDYLKVGQIMEILRQRGVCYPKGRRTKTESCLSASLSQPLLQSCPATP